MKSFWTKTAFAAAALMCVGMANAAVSSVITFDAADGAIDTTYAPYIYNGTGLTSHGDEVHQNGYYTAWFSNVSGAVAGQDLVGALVDGTTNDACFNTICPVGNNSVYGAVLNDGVMQIGAMSGATFSIQSLQASFIGNGVDALGAMPGVLQVQGFDATGKNLGSQQFALTGPNATDGSLSFATYTLAGSFQSSQFASMTAAVIFAYACDANSANCTAFKTDKAQFAIDNINVTANVAAVPEPSAWLLMGAGLAAVAGIARRRRATQAA